MSARSRIRAAVLAAAVTAAGAAGLATAPGALAATCTTSSPTGACPTSGSYATPNIWGDSNAQTLDVQNDFQSIPQTLTATDAQNWTVTANTSGVGDQTSVKSYPATQVTETLWNGTTSHPVPLTAPGNPPDCLCAGGATTLTSNFTNVIPAGAGQDFEYAADDWLADTSQPSWTNDFEVMIWTYTSGQVPAGTDTGQVYTDPADTQWEVWLDPGSSTVSSAYGIASFVRRTNATSGTFERRGFYQYLMDQGIIHTANVGVDQFNYGLEICGTAGAARTYGISGYTMTLGGTGGGGPAPPAATTDPATSVTATGAQLNGHVNPDGADTAASFEYGTTAAYGTTVAATPADAGSGTASVAESATLTGLAPSTTYHYRVDASSSAGTAQGTDATFTTPAAGGGGTTVALDSQGSGSKTGTSPLTWTQTVGTGTNRALLAEATVGVSNDTGCTQTMTDNGIVMTKLAVIHTNNQHAGFMDIWSWNVVDHGPPPSGVNTLKMTVSGCTSPTLTGASQSFTGVAHLGTVPTATGQGTSAHETLTAPAGDMIAGFVAAGNSISAPAAPAAHSLIRNVNASTGAGNSGEATADGTGSAVTFTWPLAASDYWAAGLMDLAHA